MTSEEFHNQYYDMYDKKVKVTFTNGQKIIGYFNDEFYEEHSIMISSDKIVIINIDDIWKMELAEEQ